MSVEERGIQIDIEPEEEPTTDSDVFYNTAMVTNRDISVACLNAYNEQRERDTGMTICDALAASGIRGLRYAKDVSDVDEVVINDRDPEAVENIRTNLSLNTETTDDEQVTITNRDANTLLTDRYRSLDFVDLDPYGSPTPFMDSAARSLFREAAIGVTATDLAPLFGSYRKVCERRYASKPMKNNFSHETGLRILIKDVFTHMSRYNFAFEPLLCQYERHYYRVFGKVRESKKKCNRLLEHIGYLQHCRDCGWRDFTELKNIQQDCPHCSSTAESAGPLWTGTFSKPEFADRVHGHLEDRGYTDAAELVETVSAECGIRTPYYDTHGLGAVMGTEAPRKQELVDALQEQGYRAAETHFSPKGVRTDAPIDVITDLNTS